MTEEHSPHTSVQVDLEPEDTAFIQRQVESGAYASATDILRAGLRLLAKNEHQQRVAALRLMIDEADGSVEAGNFKQFTGDGDLTTFIMAEAKARK
jgi:antitoxin ParD1/3/4